MYCKHCGSEMPEDAIFCSHCGTRLAEEVAEIPAAAPIAPQSPTDSTPAMKAPAAPAAKAPATPARPAAPAAKAPAAPAKPEPPRKPFLEGMQWNVSEYPDSNVIEKTEDINFDWNADPAKIPETAPQRPVKPRPAPEAKKQSGPEKSAEGVRVAAIFDRVVPQEEAKAAVDSAVKKEEEQGLGNFHTIQQKSAEFQQLLNREYEKINVSGAIGSEQSAADAIAKERFDSRQEEMTMDQFLEQEGAVKLYEPKPLESDVLARIEAQEKQRARQKAEKEARAKVLEEARAKAEAEKKAEIARLNNEAEASAAAAEEIRLAEEAEIRRRTEEEAQRKAAAQAAHLEALARRQAEQEQAAAQELERQRAEEARQKAEAVARAKAEEEARRKAEAEAKAKAEAEARQRAEEELNAAREAARIRAQQEAINAAREEAQFRQEQERRRQEEALLRQKQASRERQQTGAGSAYVMEFQVRDALAQTARMRAEEEEKIKAALAGIRDGRFSDTVAAKEAEAAALQPTAPVEIPVTPPPVAPQASAYEQAAPQAQFEPQAPVFEQAAPQPAVAPAPAATQAFGRPVTDTVTTAPDEIERAHQTTQQQIDEMARARQSFFADFPDMDEIMAKKESAAESLGHTRMVSKEDLMADIDSTKKISREALHLDEEQGFFGQMEAAAPAAAAAAAAAMPAAAAAVQPEIPAAAPEPAPYVQPEDAAVSRNTVDDLLSQFASISAPQQQGAPAEQIVQPAPVAPEAPVAAPEEMVTGLGDISSIPQPQQAPYVPAAEEFMQEVPAQQDTMDDFAQILQDQPAEAAPAFAQEAPVAPGEKPGLEDTMVMPIQRQEIEDAAAAEGVPLTAKEQKKLAKEQAKEAKRLAKEQKRSAKAAIAEDTIGYEPIEEEEEPRGKGGVGRTILMIILILLCVIFALELAGIGIKLLAPTSGAAEFIDNILNSLIHMITGSSSGSGMA